MSEKSLICIGCPLGCPLTVTMEGETVTAVAGNTCKRGELYARKEVTAPTRIVTGTVRVSGGAAPVVSVKTAADVPKGKIFEVVKAMAALTVPAPVRIGEILLQDVAGTGVALVATKGVCTFQKPAAFESTENEAELHSHCKEA